MRHSVYAVVCGRFEQGSKFIRHLVQKVIRSKQIDTGRLVLKKTFFSTRPVRYGVRVADVSSVSPWHRS